MFSPFFLTVQLLMQGTASSNPALYSKGVELSTPGMVRWTRRFCVLETLPSLTPKLLLLPKWPGSTQPGPHIHIRAVLLSPLYMHSPSSTIPTSSSSRQPNSVSPALSSGCSNLTSLLPHSLQAGACITLICGLQVLQPCFINIPVALLRLC